MSRIYKDCIEAINEIERDIAEMGINVSSHSMQNKDVKDNEDYATLEVQNYSFTIMDTRDKNKIVGEDLRWCHAEFTERISGLLLNPGEAWKLREDIWNEFLNGDNKMDYTYPIRLARHEQIKNVIDELRINPHSRQCIIHVHFPEDSANMRERDPLVRVPCSMYYQYMIRRGKLDVIYNMRSSDFDTHFKNDIWLADALRNYICEKINCLPGLFSMNIGSLHRYKNYTKKVIF